MGAAPRERAIMAEPLNPATGGVRIGDVVVYSSEISGLVEVYPPGSRGFRGPEDATDTLLEGLDRCQLSEQLTIEIAQTTPAPVTGGRAGTGGPGITVEVPGPGTGLGQVILAKDEAGGLSWHLPQDVPMRQIATRGGDRRRYVIPQPVRPTSSDGSRGLLGAIGSKLLKVLVFPLVDQITGKVSRLLVSQWEERNRPVRLRTFSTADYQKRDPALPAVDLDALRGGPALLFVHGNASTCSAAFGKLPVQTMAALHERYRGRVFAYDHPTLSVDPITNASWLVDQLPTNSNLVVDIVSHSRGGLVSRILCEQPALVGLEPGRMTVRTLLMVATPNSGTAMAEPKHIGNWLDLVTNMLQFFPDNPVTDTIDVVLTVIKQLAVGAMKGLNGLMSMRPGGPFLADTLNQPVPHDVTYRAITSNFEPGVDTPMRWVLADMGIDQIFDQDANDLVVPTTGVYAHNGATAFPISAPVEFPSQSAVHHSAYFAHPTVTTAMNNWLTG